MPPDKRTAVASVKVVKRKARRAMGRWTRSTRSGSGIRFSRWEDLAKNFGLLVERVEHTGAVDLVHRLQAARLRGKTVSKGRPYPVAIIR
jgi:hypothetical protein